MSPSQERLRAPALEPLQAALDAQVMPAIEQAKVLSPAHAGLAEVVHAHLRAYVPGQWLGAGIHAPPRTEFLREVCGADVSAVLAERDRAFEQTARSAGCWLPYRHFLMVCERPLAIPCSPAQSPVSGPPGNNQTAVRWRDNWMSPYHLATGEIGLSPS